MAQHVKSNEDHSSASGCLSDLIGLLNSLPLFLDSNTPLPFFWDHANLYHNSSADKIYIITFWRDPGCFFTCSVDYISQARGLY